MPPPRYPLRSSKPAGPPDNRVITTRSTPGPLNLANAFTLLRVALVPVFAWLLFRTPPLRVVAAVVFVFAAATDTLDGWVARRLRQVTALGASLDPTADKLLVGTGLVLLALDARISWWGVAVILAREVAVSALRYVLARRRTALPAAPLGKAKVWTQYVAVVAATLLERGHPVVISIVVVAGVLTVWSGVVYFVRVRRGSAGVAWDAPAPPDSLTP